MPPTYIRQNFDRSHCSPSVNRMCLSNVLSSERPQSKSLTIADFRVASMPARERSGKRPISKPRPTELPIHFCGTGDRRHASASSASLHTISCKTISATSTGANVAASMLSAGPSAASSQWRPPDGSPLFWPNWSWCTSKKRANISSPVHLCSIHLCAFLMVFSLFAEGTPTSSNGSIDTKLAGRLSNPSKRNPSACEFVQPSNSPCLSARIRDLPFQPAWPVTCPILMSSKRSWMKPSIKFRMTRRSLAWAMPSLASSTGRVTAPA
mmetsp:Transcript_71919/g.220144  ORF Transcript_71919/g.220144 Transcript_71919/m.220144 type:complete len:267 (+) Transcript_71919:566-1366(+)